jgi:hypothetical protein
MKGAVLLSPQVIKDDFDLMIEFLNSILYSVHMNSNTIIILLFLLVMRRQRYGTGTSLPWKSGYPLKAGHPLEGSYAFTGGRGEWALIKPGEIGLTPTERAAEGIH